MTSELEQKFYDTFGIEPLSIWHKCKDYNCINCDEYEFCSRREFIYPKITPDVLLELICILSSKVFYKIELSVVDREDLKECLLQEYIDIFKRPHIHYKKREKIKKLVQSLFTEVSE